MSTTPLLARAPAQERGKRTLERIVTATERLLKADAWETISVADIVREAETSTGSFYQRFNSKEALLPFLYDAYNAELDAEWRSIEDEGGINADSLAAAVRGFVRLSIASIRERQWLLRAMAIYARQRPDLLPKIALARNERVYRVADATLAPHMRCTAVEARRRTRMMTFAIITLLREHELFGDAPLATSLGIGARQFEDQVVRMAEAYLGSKI